MYLTYNDYSAFGGRKSASEFASDYFAAKVVLDSLTHNRCLGFEPDSVESPDWLKYDMTILMDGLDTIAGSGDELASYSNGVENYSFYHEAGHNLKNEAIYSMIKLATPVEYITASVGGWHED